MSEYSTLDFRRRLEKFRARQRLCAGGLAAATLGLRELTLVALYSIPICSPRGRAPPIARTQLDSAGCDKLPARSKSDITAGELSEDNGPWSLGLELKSP